MTPPPVGLICYHKWLGFPKITIIIAIIKMHRISFPQVLTLSRSSFTVIGQGQIINLVSNDTQRLRKLVPGIMYASIDLLEIGGCITAMYLLIGWQALVGYSAIAFFLVVIAYNVAMATHSSKLRRRTSMAADKKLGIIGEIIQGIRAVKMYSWEWNYEKSIRDYKK